MTYARVASGATPGAMVTRLHDDGVDHYLLDHVQALRSLADTGEAPVARFTDPAAQGAFERLRTGNEADFLDAAGALVGRLIGAMDGRTKPGLLVCVRVEDGGVLSAAALKLQVVTPNAAVLEQLDSGEEVLAAATDVLDAPGELQKGALVTDLRPGSDVIVGDKLAIDALYFPRAFGIRTDQPARDGAADLLNALFPLMSDHDVSQVARALPTLAPGTPAEVLTAAGSTVPELTTEIRRAAADAVAKRPRPVTQVDTTAATKEVLKADGITISGSVQAMRAVRVQEQPEGSWEIIITVSRPPDRRYTR